MANARIETPLGASPLTRGKPPGERRGFPRGGRIPAHAGKTRACHGRGRRRWAHPRSRGENKACEDLREAEMGASPLTRGKRTQSQGSPQSPGRIPAHAGKTMPAAIIPIATWAHPRSRGENNSCSSACRSAGGASPLTRGKPAADSVPSTRVGRIPAHAGKTVRRQGAAPDRRAHPRSRGENRELRLLQLPLGGASPLTRGKRKWVYGIITAAGRIPAHAGKTRNDNVQSTSVRAHPRSRGENLIGVAADLSAQGASPLTRGKLSCAATRALGCGRIPAHAGKTSTRGWVSGRWWAHPRSRGENVRVGDGYGRSSGASPLTRGKPDRLQRREKAPGRIPAHAGKTSGCVVTGAVTWAHPRSRGENEKKIESGLGGAGASPLTRGKRACTWCSS